MHMEHQYVEFVCKYLLCLCYIYTTNYTEKILGKTTVADWLVAIPAPAGVHHQEHGILTPLYNYSVYFALTNIAKWHPFDI